jgi:hypothetical protein
MSKRVRNPESLSQEIDERSDFEHGYLQIAPIAAEQAGFHKLSPRHDPFLSPFQAHDGWIGAPTTLAPVEPVVKRRLGDTQKPRGLSLAENLSFKHGHRHCTADDRTR